MLTSASALLHCLGLSPAPSIFIASTSALLSCAAYGPLYLYSLCLSPPVLSWAVPAYGPLYLYSLCLTPPVLSWAVPAYGPLYLYSLCLSYPGLSVFSVAFAFFRICSFCIFRLCFPWVVFVVSSVSVFHCAFRPILSVFIVPFRFGFSEAW